MLPVDDLEVYEEETSVDTVVSDVWLGEATGTEVLDRLSVEGPRLGTLLVTWSVSSQPAETDQPYADPSDFEKEKGAFLRLLPGLRQRYPGRFVAVHGEEVVEVDSSSAALVRRFFEKYGETSVYVGHVDGRRIIRNISPKIRRS